MDSWLVILVVADMAFLLGLIWIVVHYRSRRQEQKADERSKLLDRFESPDSLLAFLDSDGGRRYLEMSGTPAMSSRTGFIWVCFFGLVALVGGLAVLLLAALGLLDGGPGFLIVGGLMLAGGLGILIGTAVAFRLLGKK